MAFAYRPGGMRRSAPGIAVVVVLLLAGCASDFVLGGLDAPPSDGPPSGAMEPDPDPFGDLDSADGADGLDDEPDDPWHDLDPGDLSGLLFGVAWSDSGCPDAEIGGCAWNDNDACAPRYAVVDGAGQVLVEFESLPHQWTWEWCYAHIDLQPAGPGSFVARVASWLYRPDWGDVGQSGQAWLMDGSTESRTKIAAWDTLVTRVQALPSGQQVAVPGLPGLPATSLLPDEPGVLAVAVGADDCATSTTLHALDLADGDADQPVWTLYDPDDPSLPGGYDWTPWTLQPGIAEDGASSLLVGARSDGCGTLESPVDVVASWSPTEGVRWWMWGIEGPVRYSGLDGGRALTLAWVDDGILWNSWGPETHDHGVLEADLDRFGPGPILDGDGPVFGVVGMIREADGPRSVLRFHLGDELLWTIDGLRFGLDRRDVHLHDVVLLRSP
jgi:hypothetical protein